MVASPARRYIGEVVLRRYMVEKLVGEGSFAWVYRARSNEGETAAVKILHSDQPTATVRFAREIRVLQALPTNPYVAGYIDSGYCPDGRPLLVLEFVDGITLKLGLERRPHLSYDKAVAFVAELCQAFVELHQLGVAHRDVKPENILMAREGGIKLIDFGLIRDAQGILKLLEKDDPLSGRVFQEDLDRGVLAGTPEYMAPEQFSDSALDDIAQTKTDTSSDVFSLGVIFYELLTGRKPFPMREVPSEEYPRELLRYLRWRMRLRDSDLPPIPGVDRALSSIVRKALHRDPRRRQPDARVLMEDLLRYRQTGRGVTENDDSRTMIAAMDRGDILAFVNAPTARKSQPEPDIKPGTFAFDEEISVSSPSEPDFSNTPAGRGHSAPFFERDQSSAKGEPSPPGSFESSTRRLKAVAPADAAEPSAQGERGADERAPEPSSRSGEPKEPAVEKPAVEKPAVENLAAFDEPSPGDDEWWGVDQAGETRRSTASSGAREPRAEIVPSESPPELHQEEPWPLENLADPPRTGEREVLRAPADAPTLAGDELFEDLESFEARVPDYAEPSDEVNLADLLRPSSKDER